MKHKSENGFSVIELIIAIQLSLLVAGLAYVAYNFSSQLLRKWEDKVLIESQLHMTSQALSRVITRISDIQVARAGELKAVDAKGNPLSVILGDSMQINGLPIGKGKFQVSAAKIHYLVQTAATTDGWQQTSEVDARRLDAIDAIKFDLIFKHRKREYSLNVFQRIGRYPDTIAR